jgi:hypothetical protein
VKKGRAGETPFHFCQKVFRCYPEKSEYDIKYNIECISAGKGFLLIATCEEYILFNLGEKAIVKRGRGSKEKNRIEKLKWIEVLDRQESCLAFLMVKGFNHLNEEQSKVGKPNLHFKTVELGRR